MNSQLLPLLLIMVVSTAPVAESFHPVSAIIQRTQSRSSSPSSSFLKAIADPPMPPGDKRKKKRSRPKHGRDVVQRVESIQDYKDLVIEEAEHITVVRFYAKWCRSCQASEPLFYKLAADFHLHDVNFVEVPLNKRTTILHEALGVPSLPWTHIYHPDAGLVEERKVSKKHIADVRKSLRCYVYGECDLDDEPASCKTLYGECDLEDGPASSWE